MKPAAAFLVVSAGVLTAAICHSQLVGDHPPSSVFSPVQPVKGDPRKAALGELLFNDPRLSSTMHTSCASCHDVATNGASSSMLDQTDSGRMATMNTPSVFNSAYNYRFGWEGRTRTIRDEVAREMKNHLNYDGAVNRNRLRADGELSRFFVSVYGRPPDDKLVTDALAWYTYGLVTPAAPFDRWLGGDMGALSPRQRSGYKSFMTAGCSSCHQGRNIGGNISIPVEGAYDARGKRLPSLRVPSLRNVTATAPYFHDGRTPTLSAAVRQCAERYLHMAPKLAAVTNITAFLSSLTGRYEGRPVRSKGRRRT